MPIIQKLISYDESFFNLSEPPILINELSINTDEERKQIEDLIVSRYTTDFISLLPSCRCGATKGKFSIGTSCSVCNTKVTSVIEDEVQPIVWFKRPDGVSKLINIEILIMLKERFTKTGFDIIEWIMDVNYKPHVRTPKILIKLQEANLPRGYNNFVENFDTILDYLFNLKALQPSKKQFINLRELIRDNKDKIFSDYLPLPNKTLLIIEDTDIKKYLDPNILKAKDAILMLVSIDKDVYDQTTRFKENRVSKALNKLSDFYHEFFKNNLGRIKGQFRKHIFGTRTNFSFRAVITSITEPHNYNDLHIPWGIGLTVLEPHILNKLIKIGYNLNSAKSLILGSIEKYNKLLDSILEELIEESPEGGVPCLFLRNPSLLAGSIQRLSIVRVKKDSRDKTISFSDLISSSYNADYDGDEMMGNLVLDNFLSEKTKTLDPHNNVFMLTKPMEVSGNLSIPKPSISSISSWLDS